ncbi:hypothetical protein A5662_00450 [Mycobacteriaceae bacterium 1482268.1]|nr:hypothetical protein A5662_00450 [Mycobacteriaceae bacterium 1482268.1]
MKAAVAVVFLTAACGSTVVGTAVGPGQLIDDGATVALLDPGSYSSIAVPLPPKGADAGAVLEGQRMADAVVVPSEVDVELRQPRTSNTGVVANAFALRADIGLSRANIAAENGFIAGFSSARDIAGGSGPETSMVNLVMRFPGPRSSAMAVSQLARTDAAQRNTPIRGHPDAVATEFVLSDGAIVESFTPHGAYVLYQWVHTKASVQTAATMVAKALDLQRPRIDQFVPTDRSRIVGLPEDQSGLLAHTLPASSHAAGPEIGVYSARGALHFQPDPVFSAALFTAAGVDSVSLRGTMVIEAGDTAGAARVTDQLAEHDVATGATVIQGVAGLRTAKCVDGGLNTLAVRPRFRCYARNGRYAFTVLSRQQDDVRKQAAAQYLVLVGFRR